jgi:precorrin-6A synthase
MHDAGGAVDVAPRKLFVIGIGAGDPEYVTMQAVRALNAADVLFLLEKADEQRELIELRREIISRYVEGSPRVVTAQDPRRGRGKEAVAEWRRLRVDVFERLVSGLADGESGAFLVWGDPGLYDGTLAVLEEVRARIELDVEVVPGISAPQALAARHGIALNRVGGPVHVTTGRRLAEELPADDVVVMLDGEQAFAGVEEDGVEMYWGAYLGTPDELLIAGPLADVRDEIARVRAEARERKGWMFDTYLLRRP